MRHTFIETSLPSTLSELGGALRSGAQGEPDLTHVLLACSKCILRGPRWKQGGQGTAVGMLGAVSFWIYLKGKKINLTGFAEHHLWDV